MILPSEKSRMNKFPKGLLVFAFILFGCTQQAFPQQETGLASWYGPGLHENTTAGGEVFNMHELTAAHPKLPFNTRVRVTNLKNKKSVVVRINDRGPFIKNRIIDVSREAARQLEILHSGVARVRVEVVNREIADDTRFKRPLDSIPIKSIAIPPGIIQSVHSAAFPVYKLNHDFPNVPSVKAVSPKNPKDETD